MVYRNHPPRPWYWPVSLRKVSYPRAPSSLSSTVVDLEATGGATRWENSSGRPKNKAAGILSGPEIAPVAEVPQMEAQGRKSRARLPFSTGQNLPCKRAARGSHVTFLTIPRSSKPATPYPSCVVHSETKDPSSQKPAKSNTSDGP